MDAARVCPYRSDQVTPRARGLVRTPMSSVGHPIPGGGGDTRSATYPVDDVHQPRITWGVVDGGWHVERTNGGMAKALLIVMYSPDVGDVLQATLRDIFL